MISLNIEKTFGFISKEKVSAYEAEVKAAQEMLEKGRSSHVWNVDVFTSTNKLVSSIRVVNSVMKKR